MARLNVILSVDLTSPDITWNFIDTIIWTNVEANTAIICGRSSRLTVSPKKFTMGFS